MRCYYVRPAGQLHLGPDTLAPIRRRKHFLTNVSIVVGVVFAADRGSVAVTMPLLIPWNISMKLATVFAGAPSAPALFPLGRRETVHSANPACAAPCNHHNHFMQGQIPFAL